MTDRTSFAISIPTALKLFADAQACQRGLSVEDYIASLVDRERSHYADDAAREAMQARRRVPSIHSRDSMIAVLRVIRDDMRREDGIPMIRRILRCATGKDIELIKVSDAEPEHYDRIVEIAKIVQANGNTWPDVPSAFCRQESLVGPGEDDGL